MPARTRRFVVDHAVRTATEGIGDFSSRDVLEPNKRVAANCYPPLYWTPDIRAQHVPVQSNDRVG
jgi:hypothetical protein